MDKALLSPEAAAYVNKLENQIEVLLKETAELRQSLGIRKFLKPTLQNAEENMDTSSERELPPPSRNEKKPPPFFLSGIKSTSKLQELIDNDGIILEEMKAIRNGELKIQPLTTEDFRKLCKLLDCTELASEESKKILGPLCIN